MGHIPHPPPDHGGFATLTKGRVGGKQNSSFQVPLLEPKWHQRGTCALSVTKTLVFVSRHAHGFLFKSKVAVAIQPTPQLQYFPKLVGFICHLSFGVGHIPHPPPDHGGFATLTKGRVGGKQNSSFQVPLLEPKWHQRGTCALSVTKTLVFVSRHAHGFLFKSKVAVAIQPTPQLQYFPKLVGFICHLSFGVGHIPHPPPDHGGFATLTKGRVGGKQNSSFQNGTKGAPVLCPSQKLWFLFLDTHTVSFSKVK